MPGKTTIVIEAQTEEALAKIKAFTRGVTDSYGAIKAGDPTLQSSSVKIQTLTKSTTDAFRATQQWQGALVLLPGQLGSVASQATGLASVIGRGTGLAGVMGLAAVAGVALAKSMGDDIERLDNLSRQTGLAVSSLQAFEHAARQAGESPDTLIQGLGKINAAINDVLTGAPNAGKAFQAIGVDMRQLVKDGASTEQILEATARALAAIEDPQRKAAAAWELFGLRGRAVTTVLETIARDGFPAYIRELKAAGKVTSEVTNEMARDFDQFFDQITGSGFWNQVKAVWVTRVRELQDIWEHGWGFASARAMDRLRQAAGGEHGGATTVPPGSRTVAPSSEDLAAAKASAEQRLKAEIDANESIRKSREDLGAALAEIDDRQRKALADAADAQRELDFSREWKEMEAAVKAGSTALEEYTVNLEEALAISRQNNDAVDASVAEYQASGEATDFAGQAARRFREELDGLPPSLTATRTEADTTFIRLRDLMDGAEGSVERLIGKVREAPSAFAEFGAKWQEVVDSMPTAIDNVIAAIQGSTVTIGLAFEESIFQLIKRNLDDFDDIWKAALDAVLRQIIAFLATTWVQELIKLGTDLGNLAASDGPSGGGSGVKWWDPSTWFQEKSGSSTRLGIEEQLTDESRKRLVLEQERTRLSLEEVRNAGGRVGRGVGEVVGGIIGGGAGSALGPPGAMAGAAAGRSVFGALGEWFGNLIGDLLGLRDTTTGLSTSTQAAMQAQIDAMHATTAQTQSSQALTAAQTDMVVATRDLTDATVATTAGTTQNTADLNAFSDGLDAMSDAFANAVAAAQDAATQAQEAADSASESAHTFDTTGAGPAGDPGRGGGGVAPSDPDPNPKDPGDHGPKGDRAIGLSAGPLARTGLFRGHRGEVVATADQAGALLAALRGGMSGRTGERILAALLAQNEILRRGLSSGGRRAGATV